jgi:hypothetical protein
MRIPMLTPRTNLTLDSRANIIQTWLRIFKSSPRNPKIRFAKNAFSSPFAVKIWLGIADFEFSKSTRPPKNPFRKKRLFFAFYSSPQHSRPQIWLRSAKSAPLDTLFRLASKARRHPAAPPLATLVLP